MSFKAIIRGPAKNPSRARDRRLRFTVAHNGFRCRQHVMDDPAAPVVDRTDIILFDPIEAAAELLMKQRALAFKERLGCTSEEAGKLIGQLAKLAGRA